MAKHNNPDLVKSARDIFNFKAENFGEEVDGLIATVQVDPIVEITEGGFGLNGGTTIYTTPSDKDFYLTSATLSLHKDVTATSKYGYMYYARDGVNKVLLIVTGITLTAMNGANSITFYPPIKMPRNTAIIVSPETGVANAIAGGTITGYTKQS